MLRSVKSETKIRAIRRIGNNYNSRFLCKAAYSPERPPSLQAFLAFASATSLLDQVSPLLKQAAETEALIPRTATRVLKMEAVFILKERAVFRDKTRAGKCRMRFGGKDEDVEG